MNEKKEPKETIIRLEPLQFHNLLNTLNNLTQELKELKNITARLTAIEGELKLLRMELKEIAEKK